MKFNYPLQKVVNLKKTEKSNAEMLLAKALGHLNLVEMSLAELEQQMLEVQQLIEDCAGQPTPVTTLMAIQDYIDYLQKCINRKRDEQQAAKVEVTSKQQFLTEKTIDEKVWLKTKERAYQKYVSVMLKKEQNELDEIAITRYVRPDTKK